MLMLLSIKGIYLKFNKSKILEIIFNYNNSKWFWFYFVLVMC